MLACTALRLDGNIVEDRVFQVLSGSGQNPMKLAVGYVFDYALFYSAKLAVYITTLLSPLIVEGRLSVWKCES